MFNREKKTYNNEIVDIMSSQKDSYKSNFDYKFYGIEDLTTITILKNLEEEVFFHLGKLGEHKIKLLQALSKAKKILKHDGTFGNWCKSIGFLNREAVSIESKRIFLYETTGISIEKILDLPVRTVKFLTNKNINLSKNEIITILSSKESANVIKNFKNKNVEFLDSEIVLKKILKIENDIEKLTDKIKKLQYEKEILLKQIDIHN